MPWKKDGEKWHLGEKGFPPGQGAKWDRALLPKLLKLLREIDPTLEFKWDVRDAVTVRPQGFVAVLVPDQDEGARCARGVVRRPPRAGELRPSSRSFGRDATIEGDRADGSEVLKLWLVTGDHLRPAN